MLFHAPKRDIILASQFASITFPGTPDPDVVDGTSVDDLLIGLGGGDTFNGKAGNDTLRGDAGIDTLNGDEGNDTIEGGADGDIMDGGTGTDTLSFFLDSAVNFSFDGSITATGAAIGDVFSNFENIDGSSVGSDQLSGNALANVISGFGGDDILFGRAGTDSLYGGIGLDTLHGGDDADSLFGEAGIDTLNGDNGDDYLEGGAGGDIMNGGDGTDIVSFYRDAAVNFSLDNSITASGAAIGDTAINFENLYGSAVGGDRLGGNGSANTIYGFGGDDTLYGRGGADTLVGGTGGDTLFGEAGDDILIGGAGADLFSGGTGKDTVSYYDDLFVEFSLDGSFITAGAALGDSFFDIEQVWGSNTGHDKIAGNALANTLLGLGGNDKLYGRAGQDVLNGGTGDDWLYGEADNDTFIGGIGADRYYGSTGQDLISYFSGAAATISLDGSIAAAGAALGDYANGVEDVSGSNTGGDRITGSAIANRLFGNGGNDYLNGKSGDDTLDGGAGRDALVGGLGIDTATYFSGAAVRMSLDKSIAGSGAALGDTFSGIENLSGSATGSDTLSGNAGKNTIYGNGGNDTLYGRGGNDQLIGGIGADKLYGGTGADQFYLLSKTDIGDKIYDFKSDDILLIEGSAFGLGSFTGALKTSRFESNGNNLATTTSTRFVYRTSDDTLWYDADGKGSTKAVMIIDLATNYDFQANDLYII